MNFNHKRVVITGGTRGIGWAIAESFAASGAHVSICSTSTDKATKAAQALEDTYKVPTFGGGVDVSCATNVQSFIQDTIAAFGGIDILVNNAGITKDNLLLRLSDDDWTSVIHTNLTAIFYTTKAVMKGMMKQKFGRIINIASVVGQMGNPGQSNYAASKGGMIAFTKSVAKEYGKKNITVNTVSPGFIQTNMTETLPNDYLDNIIKEIPLCRIGNPIDVSNAVMFLASDMANYITGQVISVDGGLYM